MSKHLDKADVANIVVNLLKAGGYSCPENDGTMTPLHYAARAAQHIAVVSLLNHAPELLNRVDTEGKSALWYAVDNSDVGLAAYLIRQGGDLLVKQGPLNQNLLHVAAQKPCASLDSPQSVMIRQLVFSNPDLIDQKDSQGNDPIMVSTGATREYFKHWCFELCKLIQQGVGTEN